MAGFGESELWEPVARHDPPAFYARVREAAGPVAQIDPSTGGRLWIVARHADVLTGLADSAIGHEIERHRDGDGGVSSRQHLSAIDRINARQLISLDPPDHTRLRRLVSVAFTPRRVARLEPWITGIVDDLLARARRQGAVDGVTDLGGPVPVAVIADLVGVPAEDRPQFRAWSAAIVSGDPVTGPTATLEFAAFIDDLAARRRADPGDDLMSQLVALEDDGEALDHDELVAMIQLLLIAGQETTVDLVANGLRALLSHPDQWQDLKDDPTLATAVVDETLRHAGPVEIAPPRYTFEAVELAGGSIPAFERVGLSILGANRDPEVFVDPDTFDIHRGDGHRQLAFGHGIHYCLGAPLARLEGRIMFERIAEQLPNLRPATDRIALSNTPWHLTELPLLV